MIGLTDEQLEELRKHIAVRVKPGSARVLEDIYHSLVELQMWRHAAKQRGWSL